MLAYLLAGCSGSLLYSSDMEATSDFSSDTALGNDAAAEDSEEFELSWWRIHAQIEIEEFGFGTNSLLEFWFYDSSMQPVCTVRHRIELLQEMQVPFDEGHLWWDVQLRPYSSMEQPSETDDDDSEPTDTATSDTDSDTGGSSDTGSTDTGSFNDTGGTDTGGETDTGNTGSVVTDCPIEPEGLPDQFQIGIGAMHPEIVAAWNDIDWGQDEDLALPAPNSTAAYVSFEDREVIYVFGTAVISEEETIEDWQSFQGDVGIYSAYPFSL